MSEANFLLGQKIFQKIRRDIITGAYGKDEELKEILEGEEFISERLKEFLTQLYESLRVLPGDQVLVQRVGNSFYICEKVGAT